MRHAQRRGFTAIFRIGDSAVARSTDDGRYWFFFIVPRATASAPGSCSPNICS